MNETPMQQLADKIKKQVKMIPFDDWDAGYKSALQSVLDDIKIQMLPIEKEYLSNLKTPKP